MTRDLSFEACMALMRQRDALAREDGFHFLRPRAAEHVDALIAEFEREPDHGLRCWLLELIGEARCERALDLLRVWAMSSDESLKSWAVRGLQLLDSKSARAFLFEKGLVSQ
jgi:hypothetical protein